MGKEDIKQLQISYYDKMITISNGVNVKKFIKLFTYDGGFELTAKIAIEWLTQDIKKDQQ